MVEDIKNAMRLDIDSLAWMSSETKKAAMAKLTAVEDRIGYPDAWRDYGPLRVAKDDALGNVQRSLAFERVEEHQEDRRSGRSHRVEHDAAHGQRVLQSRSQQHQLPGRHPAAALLPVGTGRRRQLRRRPEPSSVTS